MPVAAVLICFLAWPLLLVVWESLFVEGRLSYGNYLSLFVRKLYRESLCTSLGLSVSTAVLGTALGKTNVVTYLKNGEKSAGWMAAIPPLLFLVLFYMAIVMLGSNLLNSTVEEKENRVTEMILTTLNPTDLIVGKLLATFLAGIVQTLVILTPIVIAYLLLGSNSSAINLPDLGSINQLVIDPIRMLVGGLILVGGTLLFTGSLMALGAIMPTAKEANQWFSIVILAMFIPFYIISLILSDPNQLIVQIFTFFPFTSPVTAMLRNAFSSLDSASSAVVITVLIVLGVLIIRLAVHLFRYGAMQYDSKLSLKGILKR